MLDRLSAEFRAEYELVRPLGEGGMAVVYLARQVSLSREVAIKFLKLESAQDRARFAREAHVLGLLMHPQILRVFAAGFDGDLPYIITEYIQGETLEDRRLRQSMNVSEVIEISAQVAAALAHAHERGIIHRDVKPSNVMLQPRAATPAEPLPYGVKLTDFGLAREMATGHTVTSPGLLMGTPGYVSPEQVQGGALVPATDQYALGVMLYWLITGQLPFDEGDTMACMMARLEREPDPPRTLVPSLAPAVDAVVVRMLRREPGDRFPDLSAAAAALRSSLAPADAKPPLRLRSGGYRRDSGRTRPVTRPSSPTVSVAPARWPRALALAGLVVGGLAAAWWRGSATGGRGAASPSASASASAAAPGAPSGACDRWREVGELEARVRAGGAIGRAAARRLSEQLGLFSVDRRNRGTDARPSRQEQEEADFWLTWFQVCRWLEAAPPDREGPPPPRSKLAWGGPVRGAEEAEMLLRARNADTQQPPMQLAAAYQVVWKYPDDGRAWLYLGRLIEVQCRPELARAAYRFALAHLPPYDNNDFLGIRVEGWSSHMWFGLARALVELAPDRLETVWPAYAQHDSINKRSWEPLRDVIAPVRPEFAMKVFEAGAAGTEHDSVAAEIFGTALEGQFRDPARARRVWATALARDPRATDCRDLLISAAQQRGDLAAAARWLEPVDRQEIPWTVQRYLDQPVDRPWKVPEGDWQPEIRPDFAAIAMRGLVETGQRAAAVVEMRKAVQAMPGFPIELVSAVTEFAAVEPADAAFPSLAEAMLLQRAVNWDTWSGALGLLACERGRARAESLLSRERDPDPRVPQLTRAVWLSRSGRFAEADQAMRGVLAGRDGAGLPPPLMVEVLARPVWIEALTRRATPGLAPLPERVPGVPPEQRTGAPYRALDAYWQAVRRRDLATAGNLAMDLFDRDPTQAVWGLTVLWGARLAKDRALEATWVRRLRAACRYQHSQLWLLLSLPHPEEVGRDLLAPGSSIR